ncbi:MAG: ComEC/Rec2 family competence protein [Patescibacteria group bacterium]|nr:ComEC/Rec2 family competence protein [Patescibacteria group bacterium]
MRLRFRETLDAVSRSPSRAFLVFSLSFVAGVAIAASSEGRLPFFSYIAAVAVGVCVFVCIVRPGRTVFVWCAIVLCLFLGVWRHDAAYRASAYALPPIVIEGGSFEGRVVSFPLVRVSNTVLTVDDVKLLNDKPGFREARLGTLGKARLYVRTPYEYRYGDVIRWGCKPRVVEDSEGWNDRLLLDDVRWTCNVYSDSEIVARGRGHPVRAVLYSVKGAVRDAAWRMFPEPESSFLLGLLVGMKDGLPTEMTDAFRDTGTSHILAVSGYNVTQLIEVGVLVFALAYVRRRRSSGLMVLAVIVFACIVGGDASVIRAALMGTVAVLATLFGRRYDSVRALSVAAALMLAVNPLVLRHDVGFQLSFAAVWGLYALAPAFYRTIPMSLRNSLTKTMTETASATLATAPIVLYSFGRLPYVGLVANMLILPLIPWVMLFGVVAMAVGTVSWSVAAVPALIATSIMRVIEWTALTLAEYVPYALEGYAGPVTTVLLFGWLFLLAYALSRAGSRKQKAGSVQRRVLPPPASRLPPEQPL